MIERIIFRLKQVASHLKYPMRQYRPLRLSTPQYGMDGPSAWKGIELILADLLDRFDINRDRCIEFGVEFGFSTVALSSYFAQVKGVDIFIGDEHTHHKGDHYEKTKALLSSYENIELIKSDYRDFIANDHTMYDFCHVDIIHNYKETYECGYWAATHSKCAVFHDTESFPEVRRAVFDIAKNTGKSLYNFPKHNGLGIVVDESATRGKRRSRR